MRWQRGHGGWGQGGRAGRGGGELICQPRASACRSRCDFLIPYFWVAGQVLLAAVVPRSHAKKQEVDA